MNDPFAVLGLPTRPGLSDDDVRAAWRRIAAATHPDREDGGDPATFGAAAAAYAMLRTGYGRGEALADLGLSGTADRRRRPRGRGPADAPAGPGRHRVRQQASVGRRAGQTAGWLPGLIPHRDRTSGRTSMPDRPGPTIDPADAAAYVPDAAASDPGLARFGPAGSQGHAPDMAAANGLGTGPTPADAAPPAWTQAEASQGPPWATGMSGRQAVPGPWATGMFGQQAAAGPRAQRDPRTAAPTARASGRRSGRPATPRSGGLALRVAGAAGVGVVAVVLSGWSPGLVGLLAGVVTWLLVLAGRALARRRSP